MDELTEHCGVLSTWSTSFQIQVDTQEDSDNNRIWLSAALGRLTPWYLFGVTWESLVSLEEHLARLVKQVSERHNIHVSHATSRHQLAAKHVLHILRQCQGVQEEWQFIVWACNLHKIVQAGEHVEQSDMQFFGFQTWIWSDLNKKEGGLQCVLLAAEGYLGYLLLCIYASLRWLLIVGKAAGHGGLVDTVSCLLSRLNDLLREKGSEDMTEEKEGFMIACCNPASYTEPEKRDKLRK